MGALAVGTMIESSLCNWEVINSSCEINLLQMQDKTVQ